MNRWRKEQRQDGFRRDGLLVGHISTRGQHWKHWEQRTGCWIDISSGDNSELERVRSLGGKSANAGMIILVKESQALQNECHDGC